MSAEKKKGKPGRPKKTINTNLTPLERLDPKKRAFVQYYCEIGGDTENQTSPSLVKAGFSKSYAYKYGYKVRNEPDVSQAIDDLRRKTILPKMEDAITKAIDIFVTALQSDPADYYVSDEYIDDMGESHTFNKPKLLQDLTPIQRSIVNGMDYKGSKGVADFDKITKQEAFKNLIALKKEFLAQWEKEELKKANSSNSQETEIIFANIKDTVAAKIKIIQKSDTEAAMAGEYIDNPIENDEED